MAQIKKVEALVESLLETLDSDQLLKMLDPCTKLRITLTIERGLLEVTADGDHKITQMKHCELVKEEPMTEALWNKILSLRAFSKNPERTADKPLREVMLLMRKRGHVNYNEGVQHQAAVNDILKGNSVECRMVSHRTGDEDFMRFEIRPIR